MDRVRQLAEVQRSQRMRHEVRRQPEPWPHPPPALIADPDEGAGG
jgi:hypothetical protein